MISYTPLFTGRTGVNHHDIHEKEILWRYAEPISWTEELELGGKSLIGRRNTIDALPIARLNASSSPSSVVDLHSATSLSNLYLATDL
jgi:hypothetical protein